MYVARIPNRQSNPTWLIRESKWVNGKTVKTTLANITKLPIEVILDIRELLKGGTVVHDAHQIVQAVMADVRRLSHGHVAATLGTVRQLKLDTLISPRATRVRNIILALIVSRILDPTTKLATAEALRDGGDTSSLGAELGLENVHDNEVYQAMDWLHKRKARIESGLAKRHLREGSIVLCDTSSSYVEGDHMALAEFGYSRDGKKNKKQINYGLLVDQAGRPVGIELFPGNTSDPATLSVQLKKLREQYGLSKVTLVGDRGLLTHARLRDEVEPSGYTWITALRKATLRRVMENQNIQMSLFDEQDLAEVESEDFPGERLILCRNPLQADKSAHKREALLQKTEKALDKLVAATQRERRPLRGMDKIALRAGSILGRHKTKKYFDITITETTFTYARKVAVLQEQARLDGLYAIRTAVPKPDMSAETVVGHYKQLSKVEQAFRQLKTVDLKVRPIHHFTRRRIETHFFICMLAGYVLWHMKARLAPLLFAEEDPDGVTRDSIVAPAERSAATRKKVATKTTQYGTRAMSFKSLMHHLATLTKDRLEETSGKTRMLVLGALSPVQKQAFKLLGVSYQ